MEINHRGLRIGVVWIGMGQPVAALEDRPAIGGVVRHVSMDKTGRHAKRAGVVHQVDAEKGQSREARPENSRRRGIPVGFSGSSHVNWSLEALARAARERLAQNPPNQSRASLMLSLKQLP